MSGQPVDLTGGDSVYCINETQLQTAFKLARDDAESAPKIERMLAEIETTMSRNEQAALAFVLIDKLLKTSTQTISRPV